MICGCSNKVESVVAEKMTLNLIYGDREGQYTGELKNNKPNGRGTFDAINSSGQRWSYTGEFLDGHFSGDGKTTWESGRIQEGKYRDDEMSGRGKTIYPNGISMEGNHTKNLADGLMIVYKPNGEIAFESEFKGDIPTNFDTSLCKDVPYSEYAREPEKYTGDLIKITGKVRIVSNQEDGVVAMMVDTKYGDSGNPVYIEYVIPEGGKRILEGDNITAYCQFFGMTPENFYINSTILEVLFMAYDLTIN